MLGIQASSLYSICCECWVAWTRLQGTDPWQPAVPLLGPGHPSLREASNICVHLLSVSPTTLCTQMLTTDYHH